MANQYLVKLKQYIAHFYHQDDTRTRFQKRLLSGLLAVMSLLVGLSNLFSGEYLYALAMGIYFAVVASAWWLLGKKAMEEAATAILRVHSILLLLFLLFFGSDNLSTLLWLAVIPSLTMMFLRFRYSLYFLLITFAVLAGIYLTPAFDWIGLTAHPVLGRWYFVSVYLVFSLISGSTEFMRHMTDAKLEESRQEILRLSFYDDLTQIFNRRSFDAALLKLWNTPASTQKKTSLLMIDIDNFKLYNDNFGHLQGDKILTRIALTIRTTIPSEAYTIARYGGEEFVVLMPDVDNSTATETAETIKEAVAGLGLTYFDTGESLSKTLSVSIGVATQKLCDLDSPETLIRIADENLYRAKRSGKNSVWSSTNHLPHS